MARERARPVTLKLPVIQGLAELAEATTIPAQRWVHRILFAHLHGRHRLEQVFSYLPSAPLGSAAQVLTVPAALSLELQKLAVQNEMTVDDYASDCLAEELAGSADFTEVSAEADLNNDDTSLKVRIPESAASMLVELSEHLGLSQNDLLRNVLFVHLNGRLRYEQAIRAGAWHPMRRRPEYDPDSIQFSDEPNDDAGPVIAPRTQFIRRYGKSTEAVRLWMPSAMKQAILNEADEAGLRGAEYARLAIMHDLLGAMALNHGGLPDRHPDA